MPHGTFLTFLIALATGFLSLAWVSRRSHHHFSPVTESLIAPLLHYNLWVLVWLVLNYAEANVLGGLDSGSGRALLALLRWTSTAAALLWGATYLSFTLQASQVGHPETQLHRVRQGAALLILFTALVTVLLWALGLDASFRTFSRAISSLVFLSVACASLWLLLRAHRMEDESASRKLRVLGAIYSGLFLVLTIFVGWQRLSGLVPRYTALNVHLTLEMLYNLATVLWIHYFDRSPLPQAPMMSALESATTAAEPGTVDAFGISKREQEVILLICQGLTNQEIADTLFISLKTVKDHNYRIFQKTGVRNRVELVQLVRGTMQPV